MERVEHINIMLNGRTHDITFDPEVNIICGKNGSGKTELLDLIYSRYKDVAMIRENFNRDLLRNYLIKQDYNDIEKTVRYMAEKFPEIKKTCSVYYRLADLIYMLLRVEILLIDLPEIGLHIDICETFIKRLREVNPNAQLIIATHCPSIITGWKDRVICLDK